MRRRAILSLIAATAISACATAVVPIESAPSAGMAWGLANVEGEGAKLAYGTPGTDNVLLTMTCLPRSDDVILSLVGFEAPPRPFMILGSGKVLTRLGAERTPGMIGEDLQATTRASNVALQRFAQTGELMVGVGGRRLALPPLAPQTSRAFVESCETTAS